MKLAILTALCLALSACAAAVPGKPEIYRVGELEVRLYKNQESLAQQLPPVLSAVQALSIGGQQVKVLGYFDRQNKRIYSLDDTRVLLHELKHYLEPNWRHHVGCVALDEHPDSPCREKPQSEVAANASAHGYELFTDPPLGEDNDLSR
ncbi:MAG TPA: hypothetical protein VGL11_10575 [Candidatus Binatia bacterium]|jgi:hypothetical protein